MMNLNKQQISPIHILTHPPEAIALSMYMLSITDELKGRARTIDLSVALPHEPFIPDTLRGRVIRIVGALAGGADIPGWTNLNPGLVYYTTYKTEIMRGDNIFPKDDRFYQFLSQSLEASCREENLPPELPGKIIQLTLKKD